MGRKLSKIGLIFIAILNCPYIMFLIGGLKPNPITDERIVAEHDWFIVIMPVILILLCISGLFIKDKNINTYRKCSKVVTGLRVIFGEFGAFWLSFFGVWQESDVTNPLRIFTDLDKYSLLLAVGIILLLFALPLIEHITALICFEYGLEKVKRMKNLRAYIVLLIPLFVIALTGISTVGGVLYIQTVN